MLRNSLGSTDLSQRFGWLVAVRALRSWSTDTRMMLQRLVGPLTENQYVADVSRSHWPGQEPREVEEDLVLACAAFNAASQAIFLETAPTIHMDSEGLPVQYQEDGGHGVDREADPEVGAAGHEAEVDSYYFRDIYFPWKPLSIPPSKFVHKGNRGIVSYSTFDVVDGRCISLVIFKFSSVML